MYVYTFGCVFVGTKIFTKNRLTQPNINNTHIHTYIYIVVVLGGRGQKVGRKQIEIMKEKELRAIKQIPSFTP